MEELKLFSPTCDNLQGSNDPADIGNFVQTYEDDFLPFDEFSNLEKDKDSRYHRIKREIDALFRVVTDIASSNERATQLSIEMVRMFKDEIQQKVIFFYISFCSLIIYLYFQ